MQTADSTAFGRALAKIRRARGLRQDDVVGRIPTHYSDAGAYGRVERGERRPDRDAAIAILVSGLEITEVGEISRVLSLADYAPLTGDELNQHGIASSPTGVAETAEGPEAATSQSKVWTIWGGITQRPNLVAAVIVTCSLLLTSAIVALAPGHALFVLATSCVYASLYVVSLLLESAFEFDGSRFKLAGALTFGLVAISSAAALAIDSIGSAAGNRTTLLLSLTIFLAAGVVQFVIGRAVLPEYPIVPANFQTMTAQGAHLKNTGYFLLLAILFWLPSFHCICILAMQIRAGHRDWVQQVVERDVIIGRGILALSPRCLFGLLLVILLISLKMGPRLLDNLRPHDGLNAYTILFYLRAFLYFSLALICVGWYAFSLGELL